MQLTKLRVENFRCFKDITIYFDEYVCFVGPNGAGKSTVLEAMDVFFRKGGSLEEEDFHRRNTSSPIRITLTFSSLSVDALAELEDYVRSGELVVSAVAEWDVEKQQALIVQFGSRLGIERFAAYFEVDSSGGAAVDLRGIYSKLREEFSDLPDERVKANMKLALRTYEEEHRGECVEIQSRDQFYGWQQGSKLGRHLQWIRIPAMQDPSDESTDARNSALAELLSLSLQGHTALDEEVEALRKRTESDYQGIIDRRQVDLDALRSALRERLRTWSHSRVALNLQWASEPSRSIQVARPQAEVHLGDDDEFVGTFSRTGHGLQRAYVAAVLEELADARSDKGRTLLLGFEEPELFQHPPQTRHLAAVLERLATDVGVQIVVTSHSPQFVSGRGFESVRLVRRHNQRQEALVTGLSYKKLCEVLAEAGGGAPRLPSSQMMAVEQCLRPSQAEMFFASFVVLVEGLEDVAHVATSLRLFGRWDEFRGYGGHIVECGGKDKIQDFAAILVQLGIPVYAVVDGDHREGHSLGDTRSNDLNNSILGVLGQQQNEQHPRTTQFLDNCVLWPRDIEAAIKGDIGDSCWDRAWGEVAVELGVSNRKSKKTMHIAATLERLHNEGCELNALDLLTTQLCLAAARHRE